MGQPSIDPHDPLPESTFLWRRITTWVAALLLIGLIYQNNLSTPPASLVEVTRWLCMLLAMVLTYYLVAPSAEQIVKLIQLAGIWKSGVDLNQLGRSGESPGASTLSAAFTATPPPPVILPAAPVSSAPPALSATPEPSGAPATATLD